MKCPECQSELNLSYVESNEIIACPFCGTELIVNCTGNLEVLCIEGEDWGE